MINVVKKFGYLLWLDFLWIVCCIDVIGMDNFVCVVYFDVLICNLNVRVEFLFGKLRNVYLIII